MTLPAALGLCPDHAEEFYLPLALPLSSPFVRCPEPGCERVLTIYVPYDNEPGNCRWATRSEQAQNTRPRRARSR